VTFAGWDCPEVLHEFHTRESRSHFDLHKPKKYTISSRRLADALDQWAFCLITRSPGARVYYDELRGRDKTHRQAVRQFANRWVGILHTCLEWGCLYDEEIAWPTSSEIGA
jgi:hypothetical protein